MCSKHGFTTSIFYPVDRYDARMQRCALGSFFAGLGCMELGVAFHSVNVGALAFQNYCKHARAFGSTSSRGFCLSYSRWTFVLLAGMRTGWDAAIRRQMMYESAERMSRLGGVSPSRVVDLLNDRRPQCPVQLQTLRFKPWQPPPLNAKSETVGGASAIAPSAGNLPLGFGGDGVGGAAAAAATSVVDLDDDGEKIDVERDDDDDIEVTF